MSYLTKYKNFFLEEVEDYLVLFYIQAWSYIRFFFYKNNSEVKSYHCSGTKILNKSLNQQIIYINFIFIFQRLCYFI